MLETETLNELWTCVLPNSARSVSYQPEGAMIVIACNDGKIYRVDAGTGEIISPPLNHGHQAHWAGFSRDGKRIFTKAEDHVIRVWDARSGQPAGPPLHHGLSARARLSPNGKRVLTSGGNLDYSETRLWELPPPQGAAYVFDQEGAVRTVEFSQDGQRLLTASRLVV